MVNIDNDQKKGYTNKNDGPNLKKKNFDNKFFLFILFVLFRALRTINSREEAEKLNIWVAYFNLENKFGNPPEVKILIAVVSCVIPEL